MRLACPVDWADSLTDIADLIVRVKGLDAMYDLYAADLHRSHYVYSDTIAAGASFVPAEDSIVLSCRLSVTNKLRRHTVAGRLYPDQSLTLYGLPGSTYCDGTQMKYKNTDVAQQSLELFGFTMH